MWEPRPGSLPGARPRGRYTAISGDCYRDASHQARARERALLWSAELAEPGGPLQQLAQVSFATASARDMLDFAVTAQATRAAILQVRLRPKLARQAFASWRSCKRVGARFWGSLCSGRMEEGTHAVAPVIGYGDGSFQSRGGVPTTAFFQASLQAASRAGGRAFLIPEFGSTKYCHSCSCTLGHVHVAPTSKRSARLDAERAQRGAEAAALAGQPAPPPEPPRAPLARSQGQLRCGNELCPERHSSLMNRDHGPLRSLFNVTLALASEEELPVHMVRSNQHDGGARPRDFILEPSPPLQAAWLQAAQRGRGREGEGEGGGLQGQQGRPGSGAPAAQRQQHGVPAPSHASSSE